MTRIVLVRHGEGHCNVDGVIGGTVGCTGLTEAGRGQARELCRRLARTGELGAVGALYASTLPRAIETAWILAPALDEWRQGPPLKVIAECALCELHPGEADGLSWGEFAVRYSVPNWDDDPLQPLAPGGESWSEFVDRASAAVTGVADRHRGQVTVIVCHAGVIEATMLRFLPMGPQKLRLGLRTAHASMTVWERQDAGWLLCSYNDVSRERASPDSARR
ncbi:MAG: histidine phosphatase family protein [Acidimicrobiales bacterium]